MRAKCVCTDLGFIFATLRLQCFVAFVDDTETNATAVHLLLAARLTAVLLGS
jgi:hypothetical protein